MGVLSIKGTDSDCDSKSCSLTVPLIVPTKSKDWWAVPTLQLSGERSKRQPRFVDDARCALRASAFFQHFQQRRKKCHSKPDDWRQQRFRSPC